MSETVSADEGSAALPPSRLRADHVGHLLRPSALLATRRDFGAGKASADELRAAEDEAIRNVVRWQEQVGLAFVSDGGFRHNSFTELVTRSGISGVHIAIGEEPTWSWSLPPDLQIARRIPRVVSRLEWQGGENARDFAFLASITSRIPKISLPGPCYIHARAGTAHIDRQAYPNLDRFWADLIEVYVREMQSLADVGCACLQIEETSIVKLGDERARSFLKKNGDDWRDLVRTYVAVTNAVLERAPPGMKIILHVCRSHDPYWQPDAGHNPIAKDILSLKADSFALELDNPATDALSPLVFLPPGKKVYLGLVSSKTPEIESVEALEHRLAEAALYVPLEQLAISTQCGFSPRIAGGQWLTEEIQQAKVARVVEVADRVWPQG